MVLGQTDGTAIFVRLGGGGGGEEEGRKEQF